MKRFESGEALAKEMGLDPKVLNKTFEDYNTSVRTKQDPFGKKVSKILPYIMYILIFYYSKVFPKWRVVDERLLQRCHHDPRPSLHHGWSPNRP